MTSVRFSHNPIASAISRGLLLVLFVWFAAPEAQSYTPHFNPTLRHGTEQIVVQFELAKDGSVNALTKQVNHDIIIVESSLSVTRPIIVGPAFREVNAFTRNAFYVHPTINAP